MMQISTQTKACVYDDLHFIFFSCSQKLAETETGPELYSYFGNKINLRVKMADQRVQSILDIPPIWMFIGAVHLKSSPRMFPLHLLSIGANSKPKRVLKIRGSFCDHFQLRPILPMYIKPRYPTLQVQLHEKPMINPPPKIEA